MTPLSGSSLRSFNSAMVKKLILPFVFTGVVLTLVNAAKPDISLSTSAITPRLSMLAEEEATHWRSLLNYRQQFGSVYKIETLLEYGSENKHFVNPFRLHRLNLQLNFWKNSIKLGRISHWSSITQARIDGIEYGLKTKKFGSLKVLYGIESSTDFSDTSIATYREGQFYPNLESASDFLKLNFLLISYGIGKLGKNVVLTFWSDGLGDEMEPFVGSSFNYRLLGIIRVNSTFTFDINNSQLYSARLRLSKRVGKYLISAGYRQRKFQSTELYPWVEKTIHTTPTLNFGLSSRWGSDLIWSDQFVYRFGEEATYYYRGLFQYKRYPGAIVIGKKGDRLLFGGSLGFNKKWSKDLRSGINVSYNALDYGDATELQSSASLYAWAGWSPTRITMIKLFVRYTSNPYYKTDGRIGITANVAL